MNHKYRITLLLFFTITNSYCQNLIKNPSFEDSATGKYWHDILEYCNLLGAGSVDICYKGNITEDPSAIQFAPKNGKNCLSISLFEIEIHTSDYITNDISPLKKDIKYDFSFYITPDDSCGYYVKNIDVLFCSATYLKQNLSCIQPQKIYVGPTLSFDISDFKNDGQQGKWIKLSGSFIATGKENVMVIGNFTDDKKYKYYFKRDLGYKTTKKFRVDNFGGAEYFVDDFLLTENE